jgi:RimJ/RimL family protein N-acetyltransferase
MEESINAENEFILKKLGVDRVDDIISLENASMETDTTFPLTKDELVDLYKEGYIAYGYDDDNSTLIAKVGFTKEDANKVELDVCVHPNFQGKGMGTKILNQSIEKFLSECNNLSIFLKVHPENPALKLYERIGFQAIKDSEGNYNIQNTEHGPRIMMNYEI